MDPPCRSSGPLPPLPPEILLSLPIGFTYESVNRGASLFASFLEEEKLSLDLKMSSEAGLFVIDCQEIAEFPEMPNEKRYNVSTARYFDLTL